MEFSKRELRPKNFALLNRTQRQVSAQNEVRDKEYEGAMDCFLTAQKASVSKNMKTNGFDGIPEPAPFFEPVRPQQMQTRLRLMKRRVN